MPFPNFSRALTLLALAFVVRAPARGQVPTEEGLDSLARRVAEAQGEAWADAMYELSMATSRIDPARGLELGRTLYDSAQSAGWVMGQADGAAAMARAFLILSRPQEGVEPATEAIETYRQMPEDPSTLRKLATALNTRVALLWSVADFASLRGDLEEMARAAEAAEDWNLLALANANLGSSYQAEGDNVQAITFLRRAVEVREEHDLPGRGEMTILAELYFQLGEFEEARGYAETALEAADELGDLRTLAIAHITLTRQYASTRQWDSVLVHARAAEDAAGSFGDRGLAGAARVEMGRAVLAQGDTAEAEALFESALNQLNDIGGSDLSLAQRMLGNLRLAQGRTGEAVTLLSRSVDNIAPAGETRDLLSALLDLRRAQDAAGRTRAALDTAIRAEELWANLEQRERALLRERAIQRIEEERRQAAEEEARRAQEEIAAEQARRRRAQALAGFGVLALLLLGSGAWSLSLRKKNRTIEEQKEALAVARDEAQAATQAKSQFLASMSHEIRTPMNAILGFSQLMDRDPRLEPEHKEKVQTILRSGDHLLGLINAVLDMSKIEAGGMELEAATFDLHQVLADVQSMFVVRTTKAELGFSVEMDPSLPRFVTTDERKLKQILINLLGNAVKFTKKGRIDLRAGWTEGEDGVLGLRFQVQDTGEGIAPEEQHKVFEAFEQTASGRSSQAGTGLGMPISKDFARLMGGDLTLESELGVGTTFTLEIVAELAESDAVEALAPTGRVVAMAGEGKAPTILVADDQPLNRALLRELLELIGIRVLEAENGAVALELFEEHRPDLVFMDVKMPGMDGPEAVRRIKATDAGASTPIVALTASALDHERDGIMAAGFDLFMMKPFKEEEIWGCLEEQLGLEFVREEEPAEEDVTVEDGAEITPADVAALGDALLADLREALESADLDRVSELLDGASQDHPRVTGRLKELADSFDYDALGAFLSPSGPWEDK